MPQISATELAQLLNKAFNNAVEQGERSQEKHIGLARQVRSLPKDIVDNAFVQALRLSVGEFDSQPQTLSDLLIVAEQFADRAGADRFGYETQMFLTELLKSTHKHHAKPNGVQRELAEVRARYLALARATGVSITMEMLNKERDLYEFLPLLWLDLAIRELAPKTLVEQVKKLLDINAFHPFALVPRIKLILRFHGPGYTQQVLDIACKFFYSLKQFNDAADLIARANIVEPKGWQLPFGGNPILLPKSITNVDECIAAFFRTLNLSETKFTQTVLLFRELLNPILACANNEEERRRDDIRVNLFSELERHASYAEISLTGLLPKFRFEDSDGIDWWQDLGPWHKNLPPEGKFKTAIIRSSESTDFSTQNGCVYHSHQTAIKFKALDAARNCGFF